MKILSLNFDYFHDYADFDAGLKVIMYRTCNGVIGVGDLRHEI